MFLLLKNYRIWLAALLLAAAYGFGHHSGSLKVHHYYQNILLKQAQDNAVQLQSALKQQEDYIAKAEVIAQKQATLSMQAQREAFELKKEIKDVIAKDKASHPDCVGGIGTNSLRHYRESLGYK